MNVKEAGQVLLNGTRIVVMSHYNPDADAYGSSCGLALALRGLGRQVSIVNESGLLSGSEFIPGTAEVQTQFPAEPCDLIVVCDCGDASRVGDSLRSHLETNIPVLNIDHHNSNTAFGTYNLVQENASSTSEMVFWLLDEIGAFVRLKPEQTLSVCEALYAGIVADTGSFRYSNTSTRTFQAAQRLLSFGVHPSKVAQALFGNNSIEAVRLHAEVLSRIELLENGKLTLMIIDAEVLKRCGAGKDDGEGLVEKGRDIRGVCISCLIRWDGEIWRVSLRSVSDRYNVAQVAMQFGGGGHKVAAAFRWRKSVEDLKQKLLPVLTGVISTAG